MRTALGTVAGKAREAAADLVGVSGGAASPWRDLHQLYLARANGVGAFGVAEQLGLALGIPEIVEVTLSVNSEKYAHHLRLQELVLDMAPVAILYDLAIRPRPVPPPPSPAEPFVGKRPPPTPPMGGT